jgi:hypothetical protein
MGLDQNENGDRHDFKNSPTNAFDYSFFGRRLNGTCCLGSKRLPQ